MLPTSSTDLLPPVFPEKDTVTRMASPPSRVFSNSASSTDEIKAKLREWHSRVKVGRPPGISGPKGLGSSDVSVYSPRPPTNLSVSSHNSTALDSCLLNAPSYFNTVPVPPGALTSVHTPHSGTPHSLNVGNDVPRKDTNEVSSATANFSGPLSLSEILRRKKTTQVSNHNTRSGNLPHLRTSPVRQASLQHREPTLGAITKRQMTSLDGHYITSTAEPSSRETQNGNAVTTVCSSATLSTTVTQTPCATSLSGPISSLLPFEVEFQDPSSLKKASLTSTTKVETHLLMPAQDVSINSSCPIGDRSQQNHPIKVLKTSSKKLRPSTTDTENDTATPHPDPLLCCAPFLMSAPPPRNVSTDNVSPSNGMSSTFVHVIGTHPLNGIPENAPMLNPIFMPDTLDNQHNAPELLNSDQESALANTAKSDALKPFHPKSPPTESQRRDNPLKEMNPVDNTVLNECGCIVNPSHMGASNDVNICVKSTTPTSAPSANTFESAASIDNRMDANDSIVSRGATLNTSHKATRVTESGEPHVTEHPLTNLLHNVSVEKKHHNEEGNRNDVKQVHSQLEAQTPLPVEPNGHNAVCESPTSDNPKDISAPEFAVLHPLVKAFLTAGGPGTFNSYLRVMKSIANQATPEQFHWIQRAMTESTSTAKFMDQSQSSTDPKPAVEVGKGVLKILNSFIEQCSTLPCSISSVSGPTEAHVKAPTTCLDTLSATSKSLNPLVHQP